MTTATNLTLLEGACDKHPGEATPLLMLADELDERGRPESARLIRSGLGFLSVGGVGVGVGDGGDGGVGVGGDGGVGVGDGGDGGVGDGVGVGVGVGDGVGDGVGVGVGDGDGVGYVLSRGFAMESGLYIICSPGGYYPYVRVAWCERGDLMLTLRNCRVIKRFGTNAQLAIIAKEGPKDNTQFLDMAEVEYVSVGMISRAIPCEEGPWKKHCPKPE